ncbi:hypothetical protein RA265_28510, partial [Pseudomonas syringae pv. tagetis]|uniref:hypothetical protein n=1 Tax=Pseudomonas syringae group genomosp. 7 TaxID=251699 RepID=UPI00376F4688
DLAFPEAVHVMLVVLAGVSGFFGGRLVVGSGIFGPWYPTGAGVLGRARSDAGASRDMIAGRIGETERGKNLLE